MNKGTLEREVLLALERTSKLCELNRTPADRLKGIALSERELYWLCEHGIPPAGGPIRLPLYSAEVPLEGLDHEKDLRPIGTTHRPFSPEWLQWDVVGLRVGVPGVWWVSRVPPYDMQLTNSSIALLILTLCLVCELSELRGQVPELALLDRLESGLERIDPAALAPMGLWREYIDESRFLQLTDDMRLAGIRDFTPESLDWDFRFSRAAWSTWDEEEVQHAAAEMAHARRSAVDAQLGNGAESWLDLRLHDAQLTRIVWAPDRAVLTLVLHTTSDPILEDPYEVITLGFCGCSLQAAEVQFLRAVMGYYRVPDVLDDELDFVAGGKYAFRLRLLLDTRIAPCRPEFAVIFESATIQRTGSDFNAYSLAAEARPFFKVI